jgi:polyphosphate kinase 2 (PPK2 family)
MKAENMSEEHANALAELASDRETPELASMKEIEGIGKKHIFDNANYPYKKKMERDEYEDTKQQLQIELLKMQGWVKETGQRVVILCEGRDAAGKGGTIKRFMEHLNPRGVHV